MADTPCDFLNLCMPDTESWVERDETWNNMMPCLFTSLHDALTQGRPLDFASLHRALTTWQAFVDAPRTEGRYARRRRWDFARCMLWCAAHARRQPEGDDTIIDRALFALASTPPFVKDHESWAWDCVRLFTLHRHNAIPPVLEVPVAVAELIQDTGFVCTLRLELLEPGVGQVFHHPAHTLYPELDCTFDSSMQHAWEAARYLAQQEGTERLCDGRWCLLEQDGYDVPRVSGSSAGGAAARGWYSLLRGFVLDPGVIPLTAIDRHGVLSGVGGVRAKVQALAADGRFDTIVVASDDNQREAEEALRQAGKLGPLRVVNLDASNP